MTAYDKRPDEALASLVSTLPSEETVEPVAQLEEAHAERQLLWHSVIEGTENAPQDLPVSSLRHGTGITLDDGDGDDEHALGRKRIDVHRVIAASVDKCACARVFYKRRWARGLVGRAHAALEAWRPQS